MMREIDAGRPAALLGPEGSLLTQSGTHPMVGEAESMLPFTTFKP